MSSAPTDALLAEASALSASSLLEERAEFVSLIKMQQLVRVTCLEVMGGGTAAANVDAYRREVVELQELVKGYLSEVRELRAQQQNQPPSSPSSGSHTTASVPGSPGPLITLGAQFEEVPQTAWYEHKPLPRFTVRVTNADGSSYAGDDVVLSVALLNGRGVIEEHKVKGPGDLLAGERTAPVRDGLAEWTNLRICEPSSKHYGSFTIVVTASRAPDGTGLAELKSAPLTVQVGRMWSKRRKTEDELGPDDNITQIPGIGARYVSRLQLHGVSSIGQFATMASTEQGRDTLCRLCKGDNPRNSLNQQKLQAMIDAANKVAGLSTLHKRARALNPDPSALTITASDASGCGGSSESAADDLDTEPSFSMDELMLLASPDGSDSFASESPTTPHLAPLEPYGHPDGLLADDEIVRHRRMQTVAVDAPIEILPPKGKGGGFGGLAALDALAAGDSPHSKPKPAPPAARGGRRLLAPDSAAVAAIIRAAWRGDADRAVSAAAMGGGAAAVGHDRFGCTAVHVAALGGHAHVLASLLDTPSFAPLVNAPAEGMGGATPLHLAACLGAAGEAVAFALLDAGADASALMRGELSTAHLAAWSGAAGLLGRLLADAPNLADDPSEAGLTPLDCAALGGHAACAELLVAASAGARGGAVLPALTCAALGEDGDTLALLLSTHGHQLHSCGSAAGWLPLHAAAAAASLTSIAALVGAGADVNALSADGLTALDIACACGHADVASVLIEVHGAEVPTATLADDGPGACTPLICAAAGGELDCVRLLAAHGCAEGVPEVMSVVERLHGYEIADEMRALAL